MKAHSISIILIATAINITHAYEFSERLMLSTFRIEGPAHGGGTTIGTAWLLSEPKTDTTNWNWNVLVTANHVLADISGEEATLVLRTKKDDDTYDKRSHTIRIREKEKQLWTSHPEADVAVMIAPLPRDFISQDVLLDSDYLALDSDYKERYFQPGDEFMCVGFPLGLESPQGGFPILRTGRIASYPVWPSTVAKTFMFDMPVYGGNSGGPVFYDFKNRRIPGEDWTKTVDIRGIAGLISQDLSQTYSVKGYFESVTRKDPVSLAIVIPAEFIRQTIDLLQKQLAMNAEQVPSEGRGEAPRP